MKLSPKKFDRNYTPFTLGKSRNWIH